MNPAENTPAPRTSLVLGLLLLAAFVGAGLRLLPYSLGQRSELASWLWNFTPVTAMLIFGVAQLRRVEFGILVPLAMLAATDLVLRFTGDDGSSLGSRLQIYALYAVIGLLGLAVKNKRTWMRFLVVCLAGPEIFFLVTNFVVWLIADPTRPPPYGYPKSAAGLLECYALAVPFLRNDLIGTTFFTFGLFGAYAWLAGRAPALRAARPALAG